MEIDREGTRGEECCDPTKSSTTNVELCVHLVEESLMPTRVEGFTNVEKDGGE